MSLFPAVKSIELSRFLAVGAALLALEACIIFWLEWLLNIGPAQGRIVSLTVSIGVGWYLNRTYTFRDNRPRIISQLVLYYFLMVCSLALNYGVFTVALFLLPNSPAKVWIALAAGSTCAVTLNYLTMKWLIFTHGPSAG